MLWSMCQPHRTEKQEWRPLPAARLNEKRRWHLAAQGERRQQARTGANHSRPFRFTGISPGPLNSGSVADQPPGLSRSILGDDHFFLAVAAIDGRRIKCTVACREAGDFAELAGDAGANIARSRAGQRRAAGGAVALEHNTANDSLAGCSRLGQLNRVLAASGRLVVRLRCSEKKNCAGCDSRDERAKARGSLGEGHVHYP